MTPLGALIAKRISTTGPITLADYMADCLMHPDHGYYATRDPLGAAGDFTTAPEISQMFGELVGLALAQAWLDQGSPNRITLAELGPGRGTCMADALRATRGVPGFHAAAALHLVETSPTFRAQQAMRLNGATWHNSVATLPDAPLFLIANEFFDALPIRQFRRDGVGWREVMVGVRGAALVPGLGPTTALAMLEHRLADTRDGDIVEVCPALPVIVAAIGARIASHGGAAIIIDYGDWQSLGDTLQALQNHASVDPFAAPGHADLTAHVDFAAIAAAAGPALPTQLTTQGAFLDRLGIGHRAAALANGLTGAARENHMAAHRRLTHASEMGVLFKVMGLHPPDAPQLPGLAA